MTREVIEMNSTSESVNDLELVLKSFLSDKCNCENLFGDILVALMEAVNNAIKHGNKYDHNKKVTIQMYSNSTRLQFAVSDEGEGFNIHNCTYDPIASHSIHNCHGRGLFLMRSLSDEVSYRNDGSTVVLNFQLNN